MNIRRMVLVTVGIALCGGATAQAQSNWVGDLGGTEDGPGTQYLDNGNWNPSRNDSFAGKTLASDLTLFVTNTSAAPSGMNFDYGGGFNLTLRDSRATGTRGLSLGGNISFNPTGAAGRTLTFDRIAANFNGADRTFDIGTGHTMVYTGAAVAGGSGRTLTKTGGGIFELGGGNGNVWNLQLNAGEYRFGLANRLGGSATIETNGTLNLNGFSQTTAMPLIMNGGSLTGGAASFLTNNTGLTSTGGGVATFSGAGGVTLGGNLTYNVGAANKTLTFTGGELKLGANRTFTVANGDQLIDVDVGAVVSGTGGVTKTGAGVMRLGGVNTYAGATSASAGVLLVDGSTAGGAVTVASGAVFGGKGTVNGSLTLADGALFATDFGATPLKLGAGSTFALNSSFGVTSLRDRLGATVDWANVTAGTYQLITGGNLTAGFFDATKISNFGLANAVKSGGKDVYFDNGSLALVVAIPVPEPSAVLLGGFGLVFAGWLVRRRR